MGDSVVTFKDAGGATQSHDTRTNSASEHRPIQTIGNDGDLTVGIEPFGALQVNTGPSTLLYDDWGVTPVDTTDKWTVTGTTPTVASGAMTMPATASTYNAIRSKDSVRPNVGYTIIRNGITVETTAAVGAGRFWGLGTPATTPGAAVLVQDGIGFEIDQATGALLVVTYAAGVRTTVATLTAGGTANVTQQRIATTTTVPTFRDGTNHRYTLYFRVTEAIWYIDDTPVAYVSYPNILIASLPSLIVRQNAASFTGTPVFTNTAHLAADTSGQGQSISDPVIGARMARVTAGGALAIASAPKTAGAPASNTVGVTAAAVLAANPLRTGLMLDNAGATTIYLNFNGTAPTTTLRSWRLEPGDRYDMMDGPPQGQIQAISSAAGGTLLVTEYT